MRADILDSRFHIVWMVARGSWLVARGARRTEARLVGSVVDAWATWMGMDMWTRGIRRHRNVVLDNGQGECANC